MDVKLELDPKNKQMCDLLSEKFIALMLTYSTHHAAYLPAYVVHDTETMVTKEFPKPKTRYGCSCRRS